MKQEFKPRGKIVDVALINKSHELYKQMVKDAIARKKEKQAVIRTQKIQEAKQVIEQAKTEVIQAQIRVAEKIKEVKAVAQPTVKQIEELKQLKAVREEAKQVVQIKIENQAVKEKQIIETKQKSREKAIVATKFEVDYIQLFQELGAKKEENNILIWREERKGVKSHYFFAEIDGLFESEDGEYWTVEVKCSLVPEIIQQGEYQIHRTQRVLKAAGIEIRGLLIALDEVRYY